MSNKIKELISQINILDVISDFSPLTKTGASYKTLCNVHGDNSPSLSINLRKQIYKCFVCDHGGDVIDYLIWAQKFDFPKAIEYIANKVGVEPSLYISNQKNSYYNEKQQQLIDTLKIANSLFKYFLDIDEKNEILLNFLKQRNLTKNIIQDFSIGFAPEQNQNNYQNLLMKKITDKSLLINASLINEENQKPFFLNRIVFPICDEEGNVIAFSGRKINESDYGPKYIHSKESLIFKKNSIIYNYHQAKKFDSLIVVEGFMDVIAFNRIGCNNVVAIMGVAITKGHIEKFKKHKEISLFLDNDEAGVGATLKIIKSLLANEINANILVNNSLKDADQIVNEINGEKKLKEILLEKKSLIEFVYENLIKKVDLNNHQSIKEFFNELNQYLSLIKDELLISSIVNKLSSTLNYSKSVIVNSLGLKIKLSNDENLQQSKTNNNNENIKKNNSKVNEGIFSNINKILIMLWQNPSLTQLHFVKSISWPTSKFVKIAREIENKYFNNEEISPENIEYLNFQKANHNKLSLPKNTEQLKELVKRIETNDKYNFEEDYINRILEDKLLSSEHKIKYLEHKRKIVATKNKKN